MHLSLAIIVAVSHNSDVHEGEVEVGAPLNWFKPSSKFFYRLFQGGASFVDYLCCFCLVLLCLHARLFVDALWSLAGKRAELLALVCDV